MEIICQVELISQIPANHRGQTDGVRGGLEWVAIWWYNRQKSPLNYVQDRIGRDDVEIVNSDIFQNFTAVGLEKWDVARRECEAKEVSLTF